jgi:hypothetical protein
LTPLPHTQRRFAVPSRENSQDLENRNSDEIKSAAASGYARIQAGLYGTESVAGEWRKLIARTRRSSPNYAGAFGMKVAMYARVSTVDNGQDA